jgi:phosphate:Na+ symporter
VQLLALRITDHALILLGAGAGAALLTRRTARRDLGQAAVGFGVVVLGLAILSAASAAVATNRLTAEMAAALSGAPLVLALLGAVLAMAFASSAAAVGLILVLAAGGALPLEAALALLLGANVGSATTALLTALGGSSVDGRRLALIHGGTKLAGAGLALLLLGPLAALLNTWVATPAAQVAVGHLGFNLFLAALFAPLTAPLTRLTRALLPAPPAAAAGPRYLDPDALPMPAVALGQATREVLRMADLATEMLRLSIHAFEEGGGAVPARIAALDDELDDLDGAIKRYLTQLDHDRLTAEQARRHIALLYIIADLEAIGDLIDKQLMRLARRKRRNRIAFSDEGWGELVGFHADVTAALQQALAALAAQDPALADEVLARKAWLHGVKRDLHRRHLDRLRDGVAPSLASSTIHLDLLTALSRVLSHTSNIAHAVRGDL